jgi:hypothetical protein
VSRRWIAAVLVGMSVLEAGSPTALATSELPFSYTSPDPRVIGGQVRLALELERRALAVLTTSAPTPESVARARKLIEDGYEMLRFAVSGVRAASRSKTADPTLGMQYGTMETVRAHLRTSLQELDRVRVGQADRLGSATGNLNAAVTQLRALSAALP